MAMGYLPREEKAEQSGTAVVVPAVHIVSLSSQAEIS